jgi:hypothetical protein
MTPRGPLWVIRDRGEQAAGPAASALPRKRKQDREWLSVAHVAGVQRLRAPPTKIRRSDSALSACLDDAQVIPDSSNVRKEKMRVARNFSGRRRASASNPDKNQLKRLQFPRTSVVSRLEFRFVRISNWRSRHSLFCCATISTIGPNHSSQMNLHDPATASLPNGEKIRRGGDSALRACLDDAQVVPDSSNVRKEKMRSHAIFPADDARVLHSTGNLLIDASLP